MENNSPKIFLRTNHNYAVNNPDGKNIVYYGTNKSGKKRFKKCSDKNHYQKELTKYVCGFFDYSRNEDKAKISMFEYFTGAKKSESIMEENKMKREEMMMMGNGKFATDEDTKRMQKTWKYHLLNSNVHQMVLSFNNDYIDENIKIEDLQKEVTTKIMPLFLKRCGYINPEKNIDWVVSLHCDTDNYHFHIGFIEKRKCYEDSRGNLSFKNRLEFTDDELNFFKRQTAISIEREKLYKPAIIKINKELEEFRSYFNPTEKNFILKNSKALELEEQIVKLGYLISKVRKENKTYIKYNSLPKNEIGNEIREITKKIKDEIFKDKNLKLEKKKILKSIDELNEIFEKIDSDNNISNIGFESALDNEMIKNKLERNDNYVLNAIVNHALYKNKKLSNKINKDNITLEDLIHEVALSNYKNEANKELKIIRIKILKNHFQKKYKYKDKISIALSRINYEKNKAEEQFNELFGEEKGKAILER